MTTINIITVSVKKDDNMCAFNTTINSKHKQQKQHFKCKVNVLLVELKQKYEF